MSTPHIRDYQGKHIHMIGIGGSSMSGLAQMLLEKGYRLTGSDNLETYATRHLRDDLHIPVAIGHKAENVHGADLVVYTVAILPDNPERVETRRLGIPAIERATLLGQLMEGYETAIGVCGTPWQDFHHVHAQSGADGVRQGSHHSHRRRSGFYRRQHPHRQKPHCF